MKTNTLDSQVNVDEWYIADVNIADLNRSLLFDYLQARKSAWTGHGISCF